MILGETLTYDLSIRITNPAAIRQKYRHWHNSILHLFSDFVFYPVLAQIDKAKAKDVFNYKGKKSYLPGKLPKSLFFYRCILTRNFFTQVYLVPVLCMS